MIRLDIQSEISNVQSNSIGASDIVTNTRQIGTSVLVRDGSIVTLGGLMQKRQIENKRKVPLLGDIPVMGYLFRYQSSSMVNSNLVVFMRPRILKGDASIASFSHTKYNLLRARQLQFNMEESLIPDHSPIIEDLNSKYVRNKMVPRTELSLKQPDNTEQNRQVPDARLLQQASPRQLPLPTPTPTQTPEEAKTDSTAPAMNLLLVP